MNSTIFSRKLKMIVLFFRPIMTLFRSFSEEMSKNCVMFLAQSKLVSAILSDRRRERENLFKPLFYSFLTVELT